MMTDDHEHNPPTTSIAAIAAQTAPTTSSGVGPKWPLGLTGSALRQATEDL
jgi:hypothetical protein